MGKQLVLVGGGHAHMVTLANLRQFVRQGHTVTVIGPSNYHYYSGMGPGMLGLNYTPKQIRFATRRVVDKFGAVFIQAKATRLDPEAQVVHCDNGAVVPYDVLSFNAGSFVPDHVVIGDTDRVYRVKPIERLMEARARIIRMAVRKSLTVGVVGGGAAAVEVAGNVAQLLSRHSAHPFNVRLFTQSTVLGRFPERVAEAAKRSLEKRRIALHEHTPVKGVASNAIVLKNGHGISTDFVFLAVGVKPSRIFVNSGLPTGPDGGLRVNRYLQSTAYTNIFGGGDCIYYQDRPLDKVGVYAVRQNPVLFRNLLAALNGMPLEPFDPGGAYLLIFNMGDDTGILYKKGLLLGGRPAFWIKDLIDRRFMRRFQAIESI